MASSILKQIYGEAKTTSGAVVSMDSTLKQILTIDETSSKKEKEYREYEKKRDKRESQERKRESGDVSSIIRKQKRDDKKEGGGFGLGQAAIIGALGVGAIGTAVGAYFISPEFRKFMNEKIFVPMFQFFKNNAKQILKAAQGVINEVQQNYEAQNLAATAVTGLRDLTGDLIGSSKGSAVTKGLGSQIDIVKAKQMALGFETDGRYPPGSDARKRKDALDLKLKELQALLKQIKSKEDMELNLLKTNEDNEELETKRRTDGKLHGWKEGRLEKL